MIKAQIIFTVVSLFLLGGVIELIRRRKFEEKYALLWIISSFFVLFFSIIPQALFKVAAFLGAYYLTVLFIICFIFLLLIVLFYSVSLSHLSEKQKDLVQEIGILKERLRNVEDRRQ